nr:galactinol synthase 1-like [Ipomoea batatas]
MGGEVAWRSKAELLGSDSVASWTVVASVVEELDLVKDVHFSREHLNNGSLVVARAAGGRAYVTFLAGNGDYVKGVVGLVKGLRKVGTAYPVVVAVWPDVPAEHRRLLVAQGCIVREIEPLYPSQDFQLPFARQYYVLNYSKLQFWQFTEYSKMVYLDSDMQVFENIDHLFDLADGYFYAVADCVCEEHGEPCQEILPWPTALGPRPSMYFNGGMFMFQPNMSTYTRLLNEFKVTPPTAFAEQDFLNMFFRDEYKPLPYVYNMLVNMVWRHPDKVELSKAKVVHYCVDGAKPWRYTGKENNMGREEMKMLVKKWWEIYNDPSLDYKYKHRGSVYELGGAAHEVARFSNTGNLTQPRYVKGPPAA